MIDLHDVSKVYQIGEERVHALDHVTLHIFPKEFVSVIGPSGSGKSTLMNIIGCLDVADAGTYRLDGIPIRGLQRKAARPRPQSEDRLHFPELQSDRQALRSRKTWSFRLSTAA